jgi:hypothetical protein
MTERQGDQPEIQDAGSGPTSAARPRRSWSTRLHAAARWVRAYFEEQDPHFWVAITPALLLATLLFVRSPASNYIFDEQEALLANPYVNDATLGLLDSLKQAFYKDFWGLPPTRSIGSYRPLPNLVWRALWQLSTLPWLHHWVNVVFHAVNAALVASFAFVISRRRILSWLVGGTFLCSAVITEAVTGVVGIADVLGGFGILLALHALRLPLLVMPLGMVAAGLIGLFSKESCIVGVPLVPWVALVAAPAFHPRRPWRIPRTLLAAGGFVAALVVYTEVRRVCFPVELPPELQEPLAADAPWPAWLFHEFLRWFAQPRLPADPINNPLIQADPPHRIAGALRVYWRGLSQVFLPLRLSGDYSFPQEPVPTRLVFPESVLGALALLGPPLVGVGLAVRLARLRDRTAWRIWAEWSRAIDQIFRRTNLAIAAAESDREREAAILDQQGAIMAVDHLAPDPIHWGKMSVTTLLAIGLVWFPVAYFPHSNIPVELPTVRAERFWYLPIIGTSLVIPVGMAWLIDRVRWKKLGLALVVTFFCHQALSARWHALDYTNDLVFWRAARSTSPNSAKAQLNYSVMVGARGRLEERLVANAKAAELAPEWPMAHVYYGDTLCRLNRTDEAWPHYVRGWEMADNDSNLIALGLQCLWDHGAVEKHRDELLDLAYDEKHRGSWLAYLAAEVVHSGKEHGGVPAKYRPRGYDQGPKQDDE